MLVSHNSPHCRKLQKEKNYEFFCLFDIGLGKAMTKELAMLETSKIYMLCRNMERCEVAKRQLVNETKNK